MKRDFTVDKVGGVLVLTPHTPEAKLWVSESLSEERTEWCGGVVVEHRHILDIVKALRKDGFKVNG
jgi:hypothetical protein